jgi:hypothetical protein
LNKSAIGLSILSFLEDLDFLFFLLLVRLLERGQPSTDVGYKREFFEELKR